MERERTADEIIADYLRQEENRKAGEAWQALFSCPHFNDCKDALWYMYSSDGMVIKDCIRHMGLYDRKCPRRLE